MVVAEQQLVDRRVVADRGDDLGAAARSRPRSSTCSRAGWRSSPRRGAARRAARGRRAESGGSSTPEPLGLVGGDARSRRPSRSGPPARRRRAGAPAARPAPAPARAARGGPRAQAAPASSIRARKTRWSPASAPVWAAAARAPASEEPTLSTATPTPRSAQRRERLGELRAVAVGLEEERDRARRRRARRAPRASRWRRQTAWLPVETTVCKPIPRREPSALTRDVAALGDHRHRARARAAGTESPQIAARARDGDDPVAVRPADRQLVRASGLAQLGLERRGPPRPRRSRPRARPRRRSRARAPARTAAGDRRRPGSRRRRASTGSGQVGDVGTHARPRTSLALRVDAPDRALEPGALEVAQDVARRRSPGGRSRRPPRSTAARAGASRSIAAG